MKLSSKKLAELHQYFVNEGSTDPNDVAEFLETEDDSVVEAYVAALKKRYPDVYGSPEEVAEEATSTGKSAYFLIDDNTGLTKELELVKTKNGKLYLQVIEPKDIVEIVVGGETIEVDLIKLRKKSPDDKIGNHLVSTLIVAAELAKG